MPAMHVLLVDDDEGFRATLRQLLTSRDGTIRIEEAADGAAALNAVAVCPPDVVLVDLTMPRLNGVEVTRRLKARWPDLPVIILTVHREPAYQRVAMAAGADGYIVKKTAGTALWEALGSLASGSRAGSRRSEPCRTRPEEGDRSSPREGGKGGTT
jgi:DNA-binding NarL/FixJ family response regulator